MMRFDDGTICLIYDALSIKYRPETHITSDGPSKLLSKRSRSFDNTNIAFSEFRRVNYIVIKGN